MVTLGKAIYLRKELQEAVMQDDVAHSKNSNTHKSAHVSNTTAVKLPKVVGADRSTKGRTFKESTSAVNGNEALIPASW